MIDGYIKEFVKLVNSVSLTQADRNRIADDLIQRAASRRDFSKKHVAAASAAVIVAVGVCIPFVLRSGK